MYQGYKIKALVFAGRKDTMSILFPQIKSDILDEVLIGVNTQNKEDIDFINDYCKKDKKFKIINIEDNKIRTAEAYYWMFSILTDEDTIYFKLDDDLIYFSENFFEKMVKFRIENPQYLTIYPFVLNNPLCNYLLNEKYLDNYFNFKNQSDAMYYSWKDPKYAKLLLKAFGEKAIDFTYLNIKNYEFDDKDLFKRSEIGFPICPSINCICFFGKDCKEMDWTRNMRKWGGDEGFITNGIFKYFGNERKHIIFTDVQTVHYAFFTQREELNKSAILDLYK